LRQFVKSSQVFESLNLLSERQVSKENLNVDESSSDERKSQMRQPQLYWRDLNSWDLQADHSPEGMLETKLFVFLRVDLDDSGVFDILRQGFVLRNRCKKIQASIPPTRATLTGTANRPWNFCVFDPGFFAAL